MKSRKLLIVSTVSTMKSGLSWSLIGLSRILKDKGIDFSVLISKHGELEDKLRDIGVSCVIIPYHKYGWYTRGGRDSLIQKGKNAVKRLVNRIALARIKGLIRRERFDLVHINALTDDIGARAAMETDTSFIWHIREFMEEDLGIRFCDRERAGREMNAAAFIIAVSGEVAKKFQPMVTGDIRVIYNGIDIDRFYCTRDILKDRPVRICMPGRIVPQKGQDHLISAVISLTQKGYDGIRVQFIGVTRDEAYAAELKEMVKKAGREDMFEFVGFTDRIEEYYKNSDIVCVCSAKEAFGRVTIEGMVAGTLVIGTNTGGTTELIKDGETGYLYQGDQASLEAVLEKAISDPQKSRMVAKKGQAWARELFSTEKNAQEIIKIYEEAWQMQ